MPDSESAPGAVEQLFGALASEHVPVPATGRVLARGRQRRRRARIVATLSVLAVIAVGASAASYVHEASSHSRQTLTPATAHRTRKPDAVRRASLPPAGQGALLLGLNESGQLLMTRIDSTAHPVRLPGLDNVTAVATDPGGGWVIAYHTGSQYGAPERLATVTVSGRVRPFGAEVSEGWAVTALAARPDDSGLAVALTQIMVNRLPGRIMLVPLPGHPGSTRTWTLSSALMTQAWGLSWQNDTHLTYLPGSDATGGGFAPAGVVTLDAARSTSIAPATSLWPPFAKGAGHCNVLSGTWLANGSGYLALKSCNANARLGLASVKTGKAVGHTVVVPGFGCPAGQPLDPAPAGDSLLISFCGVYVDSGGHLSEVPGIARDAAWAG
jgi:hypothetical protein